MKDASASPFSRAGALALLVGGFGIFTALLYLLGTGDIDTQTPNNGRAHAVAKGLNGYSALVTLLEADGLGVEVSRQQSGLTTPDTLVLTPPPNMDPADLSDIIESRTDIGPTLIVLPKWSALPARFVDRVENPEEVERSWVVLGPANSPRWVNQEGGPLDLKVQLTGVPKITVPSETGERVKPPEEGTAATGDATAEAAKARRFETRGPIAGLSGGLPSPIGFFAEPTQPHIPLVTDQDGHALAVSLGASDQDTNFEIQQADLGWVVFVVEPDLMNNWGLADPARARAALALIRMMDGGYSERVVFDLTTNGFGGTINLLTFAFEPPFLAATICLVLAMLILGWRAFFRFGPTIARQRDTAFGKAQLVINGADLIVRGNRLTLLAEPYAALSARRLARALGLANADPDAIEASLEKQRGETPSFKQRSKELTTASKPDAILNAAKALYTQSSRPNSEKKGNLDA